MELLAFQIGYRGIAQLIEIVRQYLAGKAYRNALRTLSQKQRKLDGQRDWLFVTAIVGNFPLCGLGVEDSLKRELGETGLNISWSGGPVSGKNVSPVALAIYQQVLLAHLHQSVTDGGVTVGMELHRMAHDVGHLDVTAVIKPFHRVQHTALDGFQSILEMRDGTLQNNIRRIIQEPVLVHSRQLMPHSTVIVRNRVIGGMDLTTCGIIAGILNYPRLIIIVYILLVAHCRLLFTKCEDTLFIHFFHFRRPDLLH